MKSIPVIFINSKAKILSLKSLEILSKTNNTSAKSVIDKNPMFYLLEFFLYNSSISSWYGVSSFKFFK